MRCFLSGLEIPNGEYSVDHYVPKFWLPSRYYSMKENKVPAIKVINSIKGIHMPCEWFDMRYELTYHAYTNWHLKRQDLRIVESALDVFEEQEVPLNPCKRCILRKTAQQYCLEREELEKYRKRWLYELQNKR